MSSEEKVIISVNSKILAETLSKAVDEGLSLSDYTIKSWRLASSILVNRTPLPRSLTEGYQFDPPNSISNINKEEISLILNSYESGEMDHLHNHELWGQFSRFLPIKYTLRVLASMGSNITLYQWQDEINKNAFEVQKYFRNKDIKLRITRGSQLASGFPKIDKKYRGSKSMSRFLNHFTASIQGGGMGRITGMCAEMGFITVNKTSKVTKLTNYGLQYVQMKNPQLDNYSDNTHSMSKEETNFLLSHIKEFISHEWSLMCTVLFVIKEGYNLSDNLELGAIKAYPRNHEINGFGTYVRGALSRSCVFGLVQRTWDRRIVTYSLTDEGEKILNDFNINRGVEL
jgi:hypothetical protein